MMMRALIFNSGLGSRLGRLTEGGPKCLVRLNNGETILHRQLRILSACGIRDYVITTGPYAWLVEEECAEFEEFGCRFAFVANEYYSETNYIYSMWLAREELRGHEVLMLHGDLVFDAAYVHEFLELPAGSYGSFDPTLPVPNKDFSVDVSRGLIRRVGVGIEGSNLSAFQALYRLSAKSIEIWLDSVERFVSGGRISVYAEDAANEVFGEMQVFAYSYEGHVLEEVDTPEDLQRVSKLIRIADFAGQPTVVSVWSGTELVEGSITGQMTMMPSEGNVLVACELNRPLIVADSFLTHADLEALLGSGEWVVYSDYSSNPTYGQIVEAVRIFRETHRDSIVSIGGGSSIDVAKCVKLWSAMPGDGTGRNSLNARYCDQKPRFSAVRHVAIPTTAGTGSESTHFAVVYVDGEKRSVSSDCLQPDVALLIPSLLKGLPMYQRKSTMLDALCQAIESHWSVASIPESRAYSARAIPMIVDCWEDYLDGDALAAQAMHRAANLAGKAINLTTTTAAHAMSYKLTSLYGVAHGHAVALCMPFAWRTLLERGDVKTKDRLREIDCFMTGNSEASFGSGLSVFEGMCEKMAITHPNGATKGEVELLTDSVNSKRLGNFPVVLERREIRESYVRIICGE